MARALAGYCGAGLFACDKSRFQTLPTTQLESTTGGWHERWGYSYGPYAAERYYARAERFAYNHPYAFARYERRFAW